MPGIDGRTFHGPQAEHDHCLVKPRSKNKCQLVQPGEERHG